MTTRYATDVSGALAQVLEEARAGQTTRYLAGIGVETDGEWTYQLADGLGSVRQMADAASQLVLARGYTPFGLVRYAVGTAAGTLGFAGEQHDAAAGLVYLRARYYDPATGRFLTRDVFPALATVPQSLHRYAYCGDDPINRTDPSGQWWWDDVEKWGWRTWNRLTRPFNRVSWWLESTAEDTERKVQNWRYNPRRETARVLSTTGKAITEFSLRKRGEMNTAGRRMASAIERGDLKELGEGYSDVLLGMTGLTDVRREAEKHGLYESWLPEGTSTGERVGASVGGGFLPVAGEFYDLYAAVTGYDPIYGERLSSGEQVVSFALFLVPGVSAGAARHADEGVDLAQAALRHADEVPDLAASLLRGGDEGMAALEAAASLARRGGDEVLGTASNAGRRAQDVVQEAQDMLRTGERRASKMAESMAEASPSAQQSVNQVGEVGDAQRFAGHSDEARQVSASFGPHPHAPQPSSQIDDAAEAAQRTTDLVQDEWDMLWRQGEVPDIPPEVTSRVRVEHVSSHDDVLVFYHATSTNNVESIRRRIDLTKQRLRADFNPAGKRGFYVTKDYAQAATWAASAPKKYGGGPAIVEFAVPRSELRKLQGKIFEEATEEWEQFVIGGRSGTLQHTFDYVEGPMFLNPEQALEGIEPLIAGGHQLAIFTEPAVALFQRCLR